MKKERQNRNSIIQLAQKTNVYGNLQIYARYVTEDGAASKPCNSEGGYPDWEKSKLKSPENFRNTAPGLINKPAWSTKGQ